MSDGFPKYYTSKDGFKGGALYVVRLTDSRVDGCRLIMKDGTERSFYWDITMDRFVSEGTWIEIPKEVIESGNVYTFCSQLGKPPLKVTQLCKGTMVIAELTEDGVFRFKVDATTENAEQFITMIEQFLKRRVTAIDVTKAEPAALPV